MQVNLVFVKNHSTMDAVTQFMHDALNSFDQNRYTMGVFLDLSKAFDVIDYNLLYSRKWIRMVYVDKH